MAHQTGRIRWRRRDVIDLIGRNPVLPVGTVTTPLSAQALVTAGRAWHCPAALASRCRATTAWHRVWSSPPSPAAVQRPDAIIGGTARHGGAGEQIDGAVRSVPPPGQTRSLVAAFDGDAVGSVHITVRQDLEKKARALP